jgi:hypothetical protein
LGNFLEHRRISADLLQAGAVNGESLRKLLVEKMERAKGFENFGLASNFFKSAFATCHTPRAYKGLPKNAIPSEGTKSRKKLS